MDPETELQPRTLPNGVVVFPGVLDQFPGHLGDRHLDVLTALHEAYKRQRRTPFYPKDMSAEEFREALANNPALGFDYTPIRRGLATRTLRASSYRELGFGEVFDKIIASLEGIKVEPLQPQEKQLIENEIRALSRGFQTGEFDASMVDYLLLSRFPSWSLFVGLDGRSHDHIKFDFQGWSVRQKPELSERFTSWANMVLARLGKFRSHRVIVGDVAGQAGLAAEMKWVGYNLPSQTSLEEWVPSINFLNDNMAAWKYWEYIRPCLQSVAPEEIYGSNQNEITIQRVRRALIAGHEVGHTAHFVPSGIDMRLEEWCQPLREIYADHFGPFAVAKHPDIVINRNDILTAIYYDLARAEHFVRGRSRQSSLTTGNRSLWDSYAYASAIKINAYLSNPNLLERQDNGMYVVKDLNELKPTLREMLKQLDRLTCTGSKEQVEDFINHKTASPLNLLEID